MVILYLLLISLMARPSAVGSEDGDAVVVRDNLAQPLVGVAKLGSPMDDEEGGFTPFSPSERGYQAPRLSITSDAEFNSSLAAGETWTLAHAKYFVEANNRANGREIYKLSGNNDGVVLENSRHGLILAHIHHHGHDETMLDAYSKALASALNGSHGIKYRKMLDGHIPHANGNLVSFVKDYLKSQPADTDTDVAIMPEGVVSAEMIAADVAKLLEASDAYQHARADALIAGRVEEFDTEEAARRAQAFRAKQQAETMEENVRQHRRRPGTKSTKVNLKREREDYATYLNAATPVNLEGQNSRIFRDHNVPMLVTTKAS